MTIRESERRAEQRRQSDPTHDRKIELNQHRVLSFIDWCLLNGISPATGRRILRSGTGPIVTQLSARRIGITIGANAEWQASRARSAGAV
jgi:hypothetical protein